MATGPAYYTVWGKKSINGRWAISRGPLGRARRFSFRESAEQRAAAVSLEPGIDAAWVREYHQGPIVSVFRSGAKSG